MEHEQEQTNMDTLKDAIMGRIKREGIAMRPRVYFTLQLAAIAFVSFLVLVLSVFIFNFILFTIRVNSHDAFFSFGPRGLLAFLTFFPWAFLLADVALIFVLEWLLRTFKFGYRIPVLYLLGGILMVTFLAGFSIDRGTPFNERLKERAGGSGLPGPLNVMYRDVERGPHDGICHCIVTEIDDGVIIVEDYRHGATTTFRVVLPDDDMHATSSGLEVGDWVMVAGDEDGIGIRAFGVRKAPQSGGDDRHDMQR